MSDIGQARLQVLIAQYEQAVSLYQHEDSLNWQKINHAIVVNGGFLAVMEVFSGPQATYLPLLAITAAAASAIFLITLRNGYNYLHLRKAAVAEVEKELAPYGGIDRFISRDQPLFGWLRTSHAVTVLLISFIAGWVYLAIKICG